MTDHAREALPVPHPFANSEWFVRNTWALALSFSCLVWAVIIGLLILI